LEQEQNVREIKDSGKYASVGTEVSTFAEEVHSVPPHSSTTKCVVFSVVIS
jgi:hypothetical protein